MKKVLLVVLLLFCAPASAAAQCDASPPAQTLTYYCQSGTGSGAVNTLVNSASISDGAILTFEAGDYTWGAGNRIFTNPAKGVTFICETQGACDVDWSSRVWETLPGNATTVNSTKFYRWSGFVFNSTSGIWWVDWCNISACSSRYTQIRVDHNVFNMGGSDGFTSLGSLNPTNDSRIYGVLDHNTFNITTQNSVKFNYNPIYAGAELLEGRLGASTNFFVEDNQWLATNNNSQQVPCLDGQGPGVGVVWRFNTHLNCRVATHGVSQQMGPANLEIYFNHFQWDTNAGDAQAEQGYRTVHNQGAGTYGVFGNQLTAVGTNGSAVVVLHYGAIEPNGNPDCNGTNTNAWGTGVSHGNRLAMGETAPSVTYRGYPCYHQPGRDYDFLLYPVFSFLNSYPASSTRIDMAIESNSNTPNYTNQHLKLNRDIYNGASLTANTCSDNPTNMNCSPFNGATGIGHGPFSQRPAQCTVGSESGVGQPDEGRGGVMYWATDQGNWNSSTSNPYGVQVNGADGVLYMCVATNTWDAYYTPYAYPHPLTFIGPNPAPPQQWQMFDLVAIAVFFWSLRCRVGAVAQQKVA